MKKEEYDFSKDNEQNENGIYNLKRRDFFRILGGGMIIFIRPWDVTTLMAEPAEQARTLTKDYTAFLHIAEDGMVTCYTGKIEMGQGIITSLAMEMADELNVEYEKVKMVMGDTDLCPYDQGTWGSLTTRQFGPNMRAAAAEAKGVLVGMASEQLKVPPAQLEVKDGVVFDTGNPSKKISYAQLTNGKKLEKYLDVKPPVEEVSKFTYVSKPYYRADSYLKVTGKAKYTGDLKLPGMLFARILRPPSHGAILKSADTSGAEKIDGVKVVRDGDFIAVVSENKDKVDEAIVKVDAQYTFDELEVNDKTIFDWMLKADSSPSVGRSATGNIDTGRKISEVIVESEFHDVYLAHAPMETHTALASFEGEKLTVWASTQSPFGLQDLLVRELGMSHDTVRVIPPFLGGGFGGKSAHQQGVEAAKLAKLTGKPVMVMWTREEEFFFDTYHSAAVIKINSGMDKNGMMKMWDYHVWFAGTRGAEVTYDVPNARVTSYSEKRGSPVHPFATGPWRAPNNNTNTFARECQIDIMASKAGIDPLDFRLMNLKDERMIGCLKAAADKFGYVPGKTPSGRGIGVACGFDAGTWVAHIGQVSVDRNTGKVKLDRIVVAQDMGLSVNPQGTLIQMEGCITMGLGYTFTEEALFEGGNIKTLGFDSYNIPRFSWLPKMECVILDQKDKPPQGGGEPAIIAMSAVVANAIHDATGARMYRVPMTPERVLEAIKKV